MTSPVEKVCTALVLMLAGLAAYCSIALLTDNPPGMQLPQKVPALHLPATTVRLVL